MIPFFNKKYKKYKLTISDAFGRTYLEASNN